MKSHQLPFETKKSAPFGFRLNSDNCPFFLKNILLWAVFLAAAPLLAQTTWTGSSSSDWNDPSNWSAGVPDAADDVTIPNVTNDPVINSATQAKSVVINSGGVLTLASDGFLTINGSVSFSGGTSGLGNNGTVHNNGIISIGSTISPGQNGIDSRVTFNNNVGGQLLIDRSTEAGLRARGTFNNAGSITIGANNSVGEYGIRNQNIFNNLAGGQINIDRSTSRGIYNQTGTFNNAAGITLGAIQSLGVYGIENFTAFNNNTGGQINIDRTSAAGIRHVDGQFFNQASIIIGSVAPVGNFGIRNELYFTNGPNGQIYIDNLNGANPAGIYNLAGSSIFLNQANITIGANTTVGLYGIANQASFTNSGAGHIHIDRATENGIFNEPGSTFNNLTAITIGDNSNTIKYGMANSGNFLNDIGGQITINRTTNVGIWMDSGSFTNSANITIGGISNNGFSGISLSGGSFTNIALGLIQIDRVSIGISLIADGLPKFYNHGTVTIGGVGTLNTGILMTRGLFYNYQGGQINIDQCAIGIETKSSATFYNSSSITIGASSLNTENGIINLGRFDNLVGGEIQIDGTSETGVDNRGVFNNNNSAQIHIGTNASIGDYGIRNNFTFNNNGIISIDRFGIQGIYNLTASNGGSTGNFTNTNEIIIGSQGNVGSEGINNTGIFTNTACGQIRMANPLENTSTFTNNGLLSVNTPETHINSGTLTNNGVFEYPQGNLIPGVVNNEIIANPISGGCTIPNALSLGTTIDNTIGTAWYLNANLTNQEGTYNQATNTLNLNVFPGGDTITLYFSVNNASNCPRTISVKVASSCTCADGLRTWTGAFDSDWHTRNNWSPACVPTVMDDIIIPDVINDPIISEAAFGKSVILNAGAGLTIEASGSLEIAGFTSFSGDNAALGNNGSVENNGAIIIDQSSTSGVYGISNHATYNNNVCSEFFTTLPIKNTAIFTNNGLFTINTTDSHINSGTATNDGIIEDLQSNPIPSILNNEFIIQPIIGGCEIASALGLSSSVDFSIGSIWYLNPNLTGQAGTYNQATNTLTITGIPTGIPTLVYFSAFDPIGGCEKILSIEVTSTCSGCVSIARIWTGATDSDWHTASNWSPDCVPTDVNDIIIGYTSNQPVINSTAVGKSIVVEAGATLTLSSGSSLSLVGSTNFFGETAAFGNNGTVQNQGTITLQLITSPVLNGIDNRANFYNNTGGHILINHSTRTGVKNSTGTFNNSGEITIGSVAGIGSFGIENLSVFNNNETGLILIDSASIAGIENGSNPTTSSTFLNKGTITLGSNTSTGQYGIRNEAAFDNLMDGQIQIDRSSSRGLFNNSGTFNNAANITVGANSNVGSIGLYNNAIFNNNQNGEILIDRSTGRGLLNNSGTFNNWASIIIGANSGVGNIGLLNNADFNNNVNGEILIDNTAVVGLSNDNGTLNNNGSISIGSLQLVGNYGIENNANFNNNSGGQILLNRASEAALFNQNGNFINGAIIKIGGITASGEQGIWNKASFDNIIGAQIEINRSNDHGILNELGAFNNSAVIKIGQIGAFCFRGIRNLATFNNSAGGLIDIDRISRTRLYNDGSGILNNFGIIILGGNIENSNYGIYQNGTAFNNNIGGQIQINNINFNSIQVNLGVFNNFSIITIGSIAPSGEFGIYNSSTFNNSIGGQIQIDRTSLVGLRSLGTFNNNATITIGANASLVSSGLTSTSIFNNVTCGKIFLYAPFNNTNTFTNTGLLSLNTTAAHSSTGFSNNGIIEYKIGGPIPNLTNNEIITTPLSGGCFFSPALSLGISVDFEIATTWFLDHNLTNPAGNYNESSNTFTNLYIPTNTPTTVYFSISNPASGGCIDTVSISITASCSCASPLRTWTGVVNTNWHNPLNWNPACVPTLAERVIIPDVANDPIISAAAYSKSVIVNIGGILTIDDTGSLEIKSRTSFSGNNVALGNNGTVENNGSIIIDQSPTSGVYGISNNSTFNNNACSELFTTLPIKNTAIFSNNGHFTINTTDPHINSGTATNDGIIEDLQSNPIPSLVNNEIITQPLSGGCTISNALGLGSSVDFTIGTIWFLNPNLTGQVGSYNQATNTLTVANLPTGILTPVYFSINDPLGNCLKVLSIDVLTTCIGCVAGSRTWTGATNADWHTASNWSPDCVPTDFNDVIIGNATNQPVIGSAALAKSIVIEAEAILTVSSGISLTIDGSTTFSGGTAAFGNNGTVQNYGTINIGSTISPGQYGINNNAIFNNNLGGEIKINRSTVAGISSLDIFNNQGLITIGANQSVGNIGIDNQSTFNNLSGGQIFINRSTIVGLKNNTGTFNNFATITIGSVAGISDYGLENLGLFNNNETGQILINRSGSAGIYNLNGSSTNSIFQNQGLIRLGSVTNIGLYGIWNKATFNNLQNGQIEIDRSSSRGLLNDSGIFNNDAGISIGAYASLGGIGLLNEGIFNNNTNGEIVIDRSTSRGLTNNSGTFNNSGNLILGAIASVGNFGIENKSTFNNLSCGEIQHSSQFSNTSTFNNHGYLKLNVTSSNHNNTGTVINHGIIKYPTGFIIPGVVNNEIIVKNQSGSCSIPGILELGSALDFTVGGTWYSDSNLTIPIGTYNLATNTLFINNSAGTTTVYFSVTDNSGGCTQILSAFIYYLDTPKTWNGSVNNDWNNALNWTPACVPTADTKVTIADTGNDPIINSSVVVYSVIVDSGAVLTIDSGGYLDLIGFILITGGSGTTSLGNFGTVHNNGIININHNTNARANGIDNRSIFNNGSGGQIIINRSTTSALYNLGGTFSNHGAITIGEFYTVGVYGIYQNSGTFHNFAEGQIKIDRSSSRGLYNFAGTFNNEGKVIIGASTSVGTYGLENRANFNNLSCGEIQFSAPLNNTHNFNNHGYMRVNTSSNSHNNSGTIINHGIIRYITGFIIPGVVNHEIIIQPKTGACSVPNVLTLGNPVDFMIAGIWYSDPNLTIPAGTYDQASNTLFINTTANNPISFYFAITDISNSCTRIVLQTISGSTNGSRIWNGSVNNDWNNSLNWTPACVPTASNPVVINDVANDPVINSPSFANSIIINAGAVLSINSGGSLTLDGSGSFVGATTAFGNNGTVHNSGLISIGTISSPGAFGIDNRFTFNNNSGGQIQINRSTNSGIQNLAGTFSNLGTINIGNIFPSGSNGLHNSSGTFNNNSGGQIIIDRSTLFGLRSTGTFNNYSILSIGSNLTGGSYGLESTGTFNNYAGGQITIDRTSYSGLRLGGFFNNYSTIKIGSIGNVGNYAFENSGVFANYSGGQIQIDRSTSFGIYHYKISTNTSSFTNSGRITIGANAGVGTFGLNNASLFSNNACGKIFLSAPFKNTATFTNSGLLSLNTTAAHSSTAFSNNGIIEYKNGSPIPNVTNNEIISNPISGGCVISPALSLGTTVDFDIATTWFLDRNLTSPAGAYNESSNTFTISNIPANVPTTVYFTVFNPASGSCTDTISIKITTTCLPCTPGIRTWTGATSTAWDTGANWNPACVPTENDDVIIADMTNDPVINSAALAKSVIVNAGAVLTISSSGSLTIDGSTAFSGNTTALGNSGTVTNNGNITIGAAVSPGFYGMDNASIFNNNPGSEILIDRSTNSGLYNRSGNFTNAGHIAIGANNPVGTAGIRNNAAFVNNSGGVIHIDRSTNRGLFNSTGSFSNSGEIIIGANASVGSNSIINNIDFINNACGKIAVYERLINTSTFTNNGLLSINTSSSHSNSGTFANNGIIEYLQTTQIPNVANNEIILAPKSGDCTISPALSLGSMVDFDIPATWFLDQNLTMVAGTYNETTNTFVNANVPANTPSPVYFSINDPIGNCAKTVSLMVTMTGTFNTWFADSDMDGFGNAVISQSGCTQPAGYVTNSLDCDDNNSGVYPAAPEICNAIDDDCDGLTDENLCGIPSALAATNVTVTSATLSWTNCNATEYQLQYRRQGVSTFTNVFVSGANLSQTLTGLINSTTYEYKIRSKCNGAFTQYSPISTFTTLAGCSDTYYSGSSVSGNSFTVDWFAVPGNTGQKFQYKLASATAYTTVNVPVGNSSFTTPATLLPNTAYHYRVRVKCGNTWLPYLSRQTITTSPFTGSDDREAETGILGINNREKTFNMVVNPNPATDMATISVQSTEAVESLVLTDALGRVQRVFDVNEREEAVPSKITMDLDLRDLPPGVYRIVARTTSGNRTVSLVKL